MSSKNNNEHFFDQDFEVTYEDDPLFHYEEEPLTKREFQTVDLKSQPKPRASGKKKKKIPLIFGFHPKVCDTGNFKDKQNQIEVLSNIAYTTNVIIMFLTWTCDTKALACKTLLFPEI